MGVAITFSRGSSQPRDGTWVSCIAGGFFMNWAIKEALLVHTFNENMTKHQNLLEKEIAGSTTQTLHWKKFQQTKHLNPTPYSQISVIFFKFLKKSWKKIFDN